MIRFSCPGCGAVFSVTDDKAGKTGKCPKCQTPFTIPAAEAPAPAAPPPAPSNAFSDLGDVAPPKKKSPSKADLDDDVPPPKKKAPSKADLDDEFDDRPKKKSRRDDDEYDDAPPKKKPARRDDDGDDFAFDAAPKKKTSSKADLDDDAPPPKKKSRRDDDDEYDDAPPKKKPARAADLDDDEDDRPKKKAARRDDDDFDDEDDRPRKKKGRRDDDDYDDDYDDRPRKKKKGKSGLLLTASILYIIAAVLYIPCGGIGLAAASSLGFLAGAANTGVKTGGTQVRVGGTAQEKAALADIERDLSSAGTALTILQIIFVLALLAGILAIPAAIGGFMKKKWFVFLSLAAGGALILYSLLYLVLTAMYVPFNFLGVLVMMLLPISFGVVGVMAAVNKNVKRVLS